MTAVATDESTVTEQPQRADAAVTRAVEATSHALLVIWSVIVIVPFLWVVLSSFKTTKEILASPFSLPAHWSFDNYVHAWTDAGIGTVLLNTVIVVGVALVLVMVLGAMCAYVLARFQFPGARFIYYLMLAGLTFPIFLAIVPLFFVLKNIGLLNTLPGLIMVYVAFALPFTVFFLYAFFKTLPDEVYEAALMDGAGEWRAFFQIMLPMARPGMAAVAIFNFLGLWNQFLLPVALNTDPRQIRADPGDGVVRLAGRLRGRLRRAVRRRRHHGRAGADRLPDLPAAAGGVGVPGHVPLTVGAAGVTTPPVTGTSSVGHPEVEVRGECGARMQCVPDLAEDRVSLGEILDDQRLHDRGGALALALGQPRPGLQQPGPAVFAHRRVQGRDGVQAVTWPSGGEQPLEVLHGQPAAVRSEPPRPRVQVARAVIIGQQRQPSQRPRVLAGGQARVVLLGGAAGLAPHVGVHRAGQVHPLGVRRLLEDGAPAVGDRGHRQPVGRFRESLGVTVEQVACREAVVVDRWERQGPGRYGVRDGPGA